MIRRRPASGLAPPVAREALASLIDIVEQYVASIAAGGRLSTHRERRAHLISPLAMRSASPHNWPSNRTRCFRGEVAAASLKLQPNLGGLRRRTPSFRGEVAAASLKQG